MVRTAHQRLLVAAAALGSVLALVLVVLTPAVAEAAHRKCHGGYPSHVATTTGLRLARSIGSYGDRNDADITVSSTADRPTGSVTLTVAGSSYSLHLHHGHASHSLPRTLSASHTYTVTASYHGRRCFQSSSASAYYTVVAAETTVSSLQARSSHHGHHAQVEGRVSIEHGEAVGDVFLQLYFDGAVQDSTIASLDDGRFEATFTDVTHRGTWTVVATVMANDNLASSTASTTFVVGHHHGHHDGHHHGHHHGDDDEHHHKHHHDDD
jgi:hypothetical protein